MRPAAGDGGELAAGRTSTRDCSRKWRARSACPDRAPTQAGLSPVLHLCGARPALKYRRGVQAHLKRSPVNELPLWTASHKGDILVSHAAAVPAPPPCFSTPRLATLLGFSRHSGRPWLQTVPWSRAGCSLAKGPRTPAAAMTLTLQPLHTLTCPQCSPSPCISAPLPGTPRAQPSEAAPCQWNPLHAPGTWSPPSHPSSRRPAASSLPGLARLPRAAATQCCSTAHSCRSAQVSIHTPLPLHNNSTTTAQKQHNNSTHRWELTLPSTLPHVARSRQHAR